LHVQLGDPEEGKKRKGKNSRAPEQHSDIEAASYEFR